MAYLQGLCEKISESAGLPEVQVIGREICIIGGHKGLYSLSTDEVIVRRKGDRIIVRGSGLRVADADETEIRICGEIRAVEWLTE